MNKINYSILANWKKAQDRAAAAAATAKAAERAWEDSVARDTKALKAKLSKDLEAINATIIQRKLALMEAEKTSESAKAQVETAARNLEIIRKQNPYPKYDDPAVLVRALEEFMRCI